MRARSGVSLFNLFYEEWNGPGRIIRNVPLHLFNSFRIANNRFQFPISALQFRCLRKDSALTIFTEQNPFRQSNNQFPIPEITHICTTIKHITITSAAPPVDFILSQTNALNTLSPILSSLFNIIPVSNTRQCEKFLPFTIPDQILLRMSDFSHISYRQFF